MEPYNMVVEEEEEDSQKRRNPCLYVVHKYACKRLHTRAHGWHAQQSLTVHSDTVSEQICSFHSILAGIQDNRIVDSYRWPKWPKQHFERLLLIFQFQFGFVCGRELTSCMVLSGFFDDMFKNRSCAWQNFAVFLSNFFLCSFTPPMRSLRKFSNGTTIWSCAWASCWRKIKKIEKKLWFCTGYQKYIYHVVAFIFNVCN